MNYTPARRAERGITVIELMIAVAIIALMAGLTYPSIASSLDGVKLTSASSEVAAFLNGAAERAARRNTAVEVTFLRGAENAILLRSTEAGFFRRLDLPTGVAIERILPETPVPSMLPRVFLLYPGGTMPAIGVQLINAQGRRRLIRIDPVTGTPVVQALAEANAF